MFTFHCTIPIVLQKGCYVKGEHFVDTAIVTILYDGILCLEYLGIGGGFLISIYNATTKKVIKY